MIVTQVRAPEAVVSVWSGEQLTHVYAIICDQCGEPITNLGDAILVGEWGKELQVVHHGRDRDCDPGSTGKGSGWAPLFDMIWQLLWNFALHHEGKHGTVKVTLDPKKAGGPSCTINGTSMSTGIPIRWQISIKLEP